MSNMTRTGLEYITSILGKAQKYVSDSVGTTSVNFKSRLHLETTLSYLRGSTKFHDDDYAKNFLQYETPENVGLGLFGTDYKIDQKNVHPFLEFPQSGSYNWFPGYYGPPSTEGWGYWEYNAWAGYIPVNNSGVQYYTTNLSEPSSGSGRLTQQSPVRYSAPSYLRVPFFSSARWLSIKNTTGLTFTNTSDYSLTLTLDKNLFLGIQRYDHITDVAMDLKFYSHAYLIQGYNTTTDTWQPATGVIPIGDMLLPLDYSITDNGNTWLLKFNFNLGPGFSWGPDKYWHIAAYWCSRDDMSVINFVNKTNTFTPTSPNILVWNRKNFFIKSLRCGFDLDPTYENLSDPYLVSNNKTHNYLYDGEYSDLTAPDKYRITNNFPSYDQGIVKSYNNIAQLSIDEILPVVLAGYNKGLDGQDPYVEYKSFIGNPIHKDFISNKYKYLPVVTKEYDILVTLYLIKAPGYLYGVVEGSNQTFILSPDPENPIENNIIYINEIIEFDQPLPNYAQKNIGDEDVAKILVPGFANAVDFFRSLDLTDTFRTSTFQAIIDSFNQASLTDSLPSDFSFDINKQNLLHYNIKKPSTELLQNANNEEPKAIQFDIYGRESIKSLAVKQPSTILGYLKSDELDITNETLSSSENFEVYLEPSYLCEVVGDNTSGNKVGEDYTFRLLLEDSNQNVLQKDLKIMASKYFLSDHEYNNRVNQQLNTIGYFKKGTEAERTSISDGVLENIDSWRLQGYAGIIPDLEMGKARQIKTKVVAPPDSTKISEADFRKKYENLGYTSAQIDEEVLKFLEAGGEFYDVNNSQYPESWVALKNLGVCVAQYTFDSTPYWNINLNSYFGENIAPVQDPDPEPQKIVADSFTIATSGITIGDLETYGTEAKVSIDSAINNTVGGSNKLISDYIAIKISPTVNSNIERFDVNLKAILDSGKTKILNSDSTIKSHIYLDNNGLPGNKLSSGSEIKFSDVNINTYNSETFILPYSLSFNKDYWIVLELSSPAIDGTFYLECNTTSNNIATISNSVWAISSGTAYIKFYQIDTEILGSFNRSSLNITKYLPGPNKDREFSDIYYVDGYWNYICKKLDSPQNLYIYPRAFRNDSNVWQYAPVSNDIYACIKYLSNGQIYTITNKIFSASPKWRIKWYQKDASNYHIVDTTSFTPFLDITETSIDYPNVDDNLDNPTYVNAVAIGNFTPLYSETYTFRFTANSGIRVYIDNDLVIDQWNNVGQNIFTYALNCLNSNTYNVKIEYYYTNTTISGAAFILKAQWSSPTQTLTLINSNSSNSQTPNPVQIGSHKIDKILYLRVGKTMEELDTPTNGAPPGDRLIFRSI